MFRATICVVVLGLLAGTASAVDIDTVPVGNPGNANDPETGYGSVADPYLIGKYEVTAGQYTEFLNAVGGVDTYGLYNTNMWSSGYGCKIERYAGSGTPGDLYRYRVSDGLRVNRPVNYVSWGDAARFSNWLHNGQRTTGVQDLSTTEDGAYFLDGATSNTDLMAITRESDATWFIPTENQWYKAAYHDKTAGLAATYFDYPTGTDAAPNNGNPGGDTGNTANFDDGDYTVGSLYWTTPVGYFGLSESPYDTFDQGGNLREWNETEVVGSSRGLLGGNFLHSSDYLRASTRFYWNPAGEYRGMGFRVASIPEPSSLILLATGALGLLAYGWRRRQR